MSVTVGLVIFFLFLFITGLAYRYHRGSRGGGWRHQGRYDGGGNHTTINYVGDHGGGYGGGGNHAGISHGGDHGGGHQRTTWDSGPFMAVSPPPPAYSPRPNNDDIAQGK